MDNEEIGQLLSKIDKKLDKLLNLNTKIAKFLHLVPVSEKEERELQLLQRKNLTQAAKVTEQLDEMENKDAENNHSLVSILSVIENAPDSEVYDDVIGSDYLG